MSKKKSPKSRPTQAPALRKEPEIQAEYQAVAAQAGQIQYQILIHTDELAQRNKRMRELNQEAFTVQQIARATSEVAKAPETRN